MKLRGVLLAAILSVGISSSAFASSYFDGGGAAYRPSSTDPGVTSIYTDIYTPSYPAVYSNSGSSAWPMITDSSSTYYVQVGWWNMSSTYKGSGVHYFFEFNDGTDYQVWNTYGPTENTTHGYRVSLSNGVWTGTEDGVTIGSHTATFKGGGVQFYEEISGSIPYNAAFAGTSTNHARFSNMRMFYNNTTYYSPLQKSDFYADTDGQFDLSNYTQGSSTSTVDFWDARY